MKFNTNGKVIITSLLASVIVLLISLSIYGYSYIQFDRNCGGYLKRSADAATVESALTELNTAISAIETNNITSGYTSVIFTTPDEDIHFWYSNLLNARNVLIEAQKTDINSVVRSNALLKLRETLLDTDKSGSHITYPSGLFVYPNNSVFFILHTCAFIVFLFCTIILTNFDHKLLKKDTFRFRQDKKCY